MDEGQYKSTYQSINPHRCEFEKAINSRICNCSRARRFNLADREGVACTSVHRQERCHHVLSTLREKARFALQHPEVRQTLAHTEEIKVQNGGMLSLQAQVEEDQMLTVQDIDSLIDKAERQFNGIEGFPYSRLMQGIIAYRLRGRRRKPRSGK